MRIGTPAPEANWRAGAIVCAKAIKGQKKPVNQGDF